MFFSLLFYFLCYSVIAKRGKFSGFGVHLTEKGTYSSHQQTTNILRWVIGDSDCANNKYRTTRKNLFLDVGANSGFFGLLALASGCRAAIIEFEPELASRLKRAININSFQHNAVVINQAISNQAGKIAQIKRGSWGGLTYMKEENVKIFDMDSLDSHNQARTTTITEIMNKRSRYDDGDLIAIKIDVEGAELKALQGALPLLRRLHAKDVDLLPDIVCEIGPLSRWIM